MVSRRDRPLQTWKTFLCNHMEGIASIDLFVVPTIAFEQLFAFLVLGHRRRQLLWIAVTRNPTGEWLARERSIAHRRGGWVVLHPRGPRSGSSYAVSDRHHLIDPIRPTREHIAISPHGGLYAMPSLCGSAEATRGWFRAFATIPSWHAALYDPG